jgi:outer membrane biosynthesis protein TonB
MEQQQFTVCGAKRDYQQSLVALLYQAHLAQGLIVSTMRGDPNCLDRAHDFLRRATRETRSLIGQLASSNSTASEDPAKPEPAPAHRAVTSAGPEPERQPEPEPEWQPEPEPERQPEPEPEWQPEPEPEPAPTPAEPEPKPERWRIKRHADQPEAVADLDQKRSDRKRQKKDLAVTIARLRERRATRMHGGDRQQRFGRRF